MPKKLPKTLSTSKIVRGGKGTPKNKTSAKGKPEPDVKKQTPPKRNKKQKDGISLLVCRALRSVFRKSIEAISGPSRVAVQSFLRAVFSPLTEKNSEDHISVESFRRAVDLRLPFSTRQILHTPLDDLIHRMPSVDEIELPGTDYISMLDELVILFGGKKIKGGSVDCHRLIMAVVCQNPAMVETVKALRKAVRLQIQRHPLAKSDKAGATQEVCDVLKRSGYAQRFDAVAYQQILDSGVDSVRVSDDEIKKFLKESKLITEFVSQSKRNKLRSTVDEFTAQENKMNKNQLRWISSQNELRPDPESRSKATKKKKNKLKIIKMKSASSKSPGNQAAKVVGLSLQDFTSFPDFVHTVRCLVNDLLLPRPRAAKLPETHAILPMPSVFRRGWLTDLKLSNCVAMERRLSVLGYHRVPVNIHHHHNLHVLDQHHLGSDKEGCTMSTYLWYRRTEAPMADTDEDSLRIGDGFFILDIVAGQKPPAVPLEGGELREYEQVCGITASPTTNARRGTVLLSSTMLSESFAHGESDQKLAPSAQAQDTEKQISKDMAYVVAEVQLWMLRVPVPSETESHVTPPAALDDIALALPLLLSPPHFCRTGLSKINKESLFSTEEVELDALCEHTSSFYTVQRQLSKSMILVPGLGRIPPKSSSSSGKTSGSRKKHGKRLPGPGPMRLKADLLFRCGSTLRPKLKTGSRKIEELSVSWLTVCMHRHCPPSILLLLQELQAMMWEFVEVETTKSPDHVVAFRKGKFFDNDDERGVRKAKHDRGHTDHTQEFKLSKLKEKRHILLDHFFAGSSSKKSSKKKSTHEVADDPITPETFAKQVVKMFQSTRKKSKAQFKLSSKEAQALAKQIVDIHVLKHQTKEKTSVIEHRMWSQIAQWLVPGPDQQKNITRQNLVSFFENFLPAAPECTKLVPVQPIQDPPAEGTETEPDNHILAACMRGSRELKKKIVYDSDPDGIGVLISFGLLKNTFNEMCKKRKLKKDVCGRGFSVGRFKKALKTALDADETEDEILLALAQLISGHSVCADLGRYVVDARAFTEFALTNLYDTEAASKTAISISNTTIEVKVSRNMKPGDILKTTIPGRSAKFKFVIPDGASPGELISIALPRGNEDEDDDEEHDESGKDKGDKKSSRHKSHRLKKNKKLSKSKKRVSFADEDRYDRLHSSRRGSARDSDEESRLYHSPAKAYGNRDTGVPRKVLRVIITPAEYKAKSRAFYKGASLEFISTTGSNGSGCVCRSKPLAVRDKRASSPPCWAAVEVPLQELCGGNSRRPFRLAICAPRSGGDSSSSSISSASDSSDEPQTQQLAICSTTVAKILSIEQDPTATLELRLASDQIKKMPRGWHPKLRVQSAEVFERTANVGPDETQHLGDSLSTPKSARQMQLTDLQTEEFPGVHDSHAASNHEQRHDRHHGDHHYSISDAKKHAPHNSGRTRHQYYSYGVSTDTLPPTVKGALKVCVMSATGLRPIDSSGGSKSHKYDRHRDDRRKGGRTKRINPFVQLSLVPDLALVSQSKDDKVTQHPNSLTTWRSKVLFDGSLDPCFAAALPAHAREHSFAPLLFGRRESVVDWPQIRVQVCHSGSYARDGTPLAHGMISLREIIHSAKELSESHTKGADRGRDENEQAPVDVLILSLQCRHLQTSVGRSSREPCFFEVERALHEELDDSEENSASTERHRHGYHDDSDNSEASEGRISSRHGSNHRRDHYDHDRENDRRAHRHQHQGPAHQSHSCWLRVFKSSVQDRYTKWEGLQIPLYALTGQVPREQVMKQKLRFSFWNSIDDGRSDLEPWCNLLARCVVTLGSLRNAARKRSPTRLVYSPAMLSKLGDEVDDRAYIVVDEASIIKRVVPPLPRNIHLSLGLSLEKASQVHQVRTRGSARSDSSTAESTDAESYDSVDVDSEDGHHEHRRHHHHHVHNDFPPEIAMQCEWTPGVEVKNKFTKKLSLSIQLRGLKDLPKRLGQSRSLCWVKVVRRPLRGATSSSKAKAAQPPSKNTLDLGDLLDLDEEEQMKEKLESAKVQVNSHGHIVWHSGGPAGSRLRQRRKSNNESKKQDECLHVVIQPEEANSILAKAAVEDLGHDNRATTSSRTANNDQGFRLEAQVFASVTTSTKTVDALVGWSNLPLHDMVAELHKSSEPSRTASAQPTGGAEVDLDDLFSDAATKDDAKSEAKKAVSLLLTDRRGQTSRGVLIATLMLSDRPHPTATMDDNNDDSGDRTTATKLVRQAIMQAPRTPRDFSFQNIVDRMSAGSGLRDHLSTVDKDASGLVDAVEFVMAVDAAGVSLQADDVAALLRRLSTESELEEFKSGSRKTVMLDYDMFCSATMTTKGSDSPADAALANCRDRIRDQPQAMVTCKRLLSKLDQSTDVTLSRGQFKRVLRMSFGSGVLSEQKMDAIATLAADASGDRVKYQRFIELVESKQTPSKNSASANTVSTNPLIDRLREWLMTPVGSSGELMSKKVMTRLSSFDDDGDFGPVVSRACLRRVLTRLKSPVASHDWKDLFQLLQRSPNRQGNNIADENGEILYRDFLTFCLQAKGVSGGYGGERHDSYGGGRHTKARDRQPNDVVKSRRVRELLLRAVYRSSDVKRKFRRLLEAQDDSGEGLVSIPVFEDVIDTLVNDPPTSADQLRLLKRMFGTDEGMFRYEPFLSFITFKSADVKELSGALGNLDRRTLMDAFEQFDIHYTGHVLASQFKVAVQKILQLHLSKYQIKALADFFKKKTRKSRGGEVSVDYVRFINELFPGAAGRSTRRRESPRRSRPGLRIDTSPTSASSPRKSRHSTPNMSPILPVKSSNNLGLSVTPLNVTRKSIAGTSSSLDLSNTSVHQGLRLDTSATWICPCCAYPQKQLAYKAGCEMCSTPNPNPVFADPSQKTPPKPTTSWVCPNCTMENPVGVKRCQVCFADFPQSPEKSTPNSSNISRKDSLGTSLLMVSETSESEPEPDPSPLVSSRRPSTSRNSRRDQSTFSRIQRKRTHRDRAPQAIDSGTSSGDDPTMYMSQENPTAASNKKNRRKYDSRRRIQHSADPHHAINPHQQYYPGAPMGASIAAAFQRPHQSVVHPHYPQPLPQHQQHPMYANMTMNPHMERPPQMYSTMGPRDPHLDSFRQPQHHQQRHNQQQQRMYPSMGTMGANPHGGTMGANPRGNPLWRTQKEVIEAKTAWFAENRKKKRAASRIRKARSTKRKDKVSIRRSGSSRGAPLSSRNTARKKFSGALNSTIGGGTGMMVLGSPRKQVRRSNTTPL